MSEVDEGVRSTLLLVEDEPMLRQVVAVTLRREGFDVIEARDGDEGLAVLHGDRSVEVMLTDVRMPGLSGYQLAEASLELRPAMPVILMTGYTDEEMPQPLRDRSIPTIRKPFNFATLGSIVRDLMRRN